MIYSRFVSNRPEPTTLLELWCMIGGFILVVFIAADTEMGFSGIPRLETILALVFPAVFFFLHYMSREFSVFKSILLVSFFVGIATSLWLFFDPIHPRNSLPFSDMALFFFCLISLALMITKSMRN